MTFHISIPPPHSVPGVNRRRHGRINCHGVSCSIGEVVEISASGAKLRTSDDLLKPGAKPTIRIQGVDDPVEIEVEVVWAVDDTAPGRTGQILLGVRFTELTDLARKALTQLARAAASNPTVGARSANAA